VAPLGITINNVMPGYTRTDRVTALAAAAAARRGVAVEEVLAEYVRDTPMGRMGEPAEFGAMVAFLCSVQASYTTGASIPVDGGRIRALV
jgi:3-oxoacyl-[acyl-carrier protein] reductase